MEEILLAAALGFSGGVSPGPMLVLILSQTVNHGFKEGLKVALGPLLTDAPIIVGAWLFAEQIPKEHLNWLYLPGGLYLLYTAKNTWSISFQEVKAQERSPDSIKKGIITNVLNPAPYLFWMTIGAPLLVKMDGAVQTAFFFHRFLYGTAGNQTGARVFVFKR